MALVLIATPSAPNANSYATAAEGDTYHETRLFSTGWTAANTATKEAALVWATRLIDEWFTFYRYRTLQTQSLEWPRIGLVARAGWGLQPDDAVPIEIKNAAAELARKLIVADLSADSDVEVQGITSLRAGPVALTFKNSVVAKVIPDSVVALIPPTWGYLRSTGFRAVERY